MGMGVTVVSPSPHHHHIALPEKIGRGYNIDMSQLFRVLYDFDAEEEGEMTVSAGDIVKVIPQDDGPDGWNDPRNGWVFVQSTRTGRTGYVPIDYLEPAQKAAPSPNKTKNSPSSSVIGAMKLASNRPSYDTPDAPSQDVRMSLSSLLDRAKSAEEGQRENGSAGDARVQYIQTPGGCSATDMSFTSNTPSADKKIAADSLPFGLGESPAFGKQALASLAGSASKGTAVGSASQVGKSGKLLKAAKSVQNMVRVTNIVAAPRVPSLATAAEREDFEELIKKNDEYFARLLASQAETFDSLTDMVDALSTKLNDSAKCSNDLVSKLSELDELIDEEKRKWKQQNEAEKNADVIGRSKDLIRGGDKDAKNSQQSFAV